MLRMGRNDHSIEAPLLPLRRAPACRSAQIHKLLIIKVLTKNLADRIMCAATIMSDSFTNNASK